METLDEIDLDILRLLLEDARRPYSDIAERVDVSAPTVSDRIGRLADVGVIEGFTVDVDRTTFTDGIDVLIELELDGSVGGNDRLLDRLARVEQLEHVVSTAGTRVFVIGTIRPDRVRDVLEAAIEFEHVDSYRVHIVDEHVWNPTIETGLENDGDAADDETNGDEERDALTPTQ